MPGPLTKSSLAELEQCERRHWLSRHRPDLAAEIDDDVFADGRRVGDLARRLLPEGRLIEAKDREAALAETADAMAARDRPIFEAAFHHGDVYVRADLLIPEEDGWRLAEVKASSKPKAHHFADLSTQLWVLEGCGVTVSRAVVRHIDNRFVYAGDGEYAGIFKDHEGGQALQEALAGRAALVARAAALGLEEPQTAIGDHCRSPSACPYTSHCARGAPAAPDFPVSLLPGAAGKAAGRRLAEAGYLDLRDVPDGLLEDPIQQRILQVTRDQRPHHDREGLIAAIAAWGQPRHYLDFETIAPVIPIWADSKPYQALPFQFSCHTERADGTMSHSEFLDLSGEDPSRPCAEALIAALGDFGPIITYNLPTERGGLKALAERCPDLAPALQALIDRLVDLLPLVRAHYYHPDMRGSFSIKDVLPTAVPDLSYEDLEVQDGRAAQCAWIEAVDRATPPERREALNEAMLRYCERDTWAMVELVRTLAAPETG
ncbi:DUF2779 domain-containing protein [Brevundimonas fluminis]|uniref:DUF2779 domain-containing protein n=1 Tax=Brevundimonas fluminis TaxID=2487274 RepID=UPI000F657C0B|nr:DUF2779 domain-containing protein [Brevundimonas fluminis]